jgi:hypothetical protein
MEEQFYKLCGNTISTPKKRLNKLISFYETFEDIIDVHSDNDKCMICATKSNNLNILKWLYYDITGFNIKKSLKKLLFIAESHNYQEIIDWLNNFKSVDNKKNISDISNDLLISVSNRDKTNNSDSLLLSPNNKFKTVNFEYMIVSENNRIITI